jgi:hypothetical protein
MPEWRRRGESEGRTPQAVLEQITTWTYDELDGLIAKKNRKRTMASLDRPNPPLRAF